MHILCDLFPVRAILHTIFISGELCLLRFDRKSQLTISGPRVGPDGLIVCANELESTRVLSLYLTFVLFLV